MTPREAIAQLRVGDRAFAIHRAVRGDVTEIVALLRDDGIGSLREGDDLRPYLDAFELIDRDPAHLLAVVRDDAGAAVATLQLTLLPGLSRNATLRLQIEAVRVADAARGTGLGTALLEWAAAYGQSRGARLAQLTTDKRRGDAQRFYERLGYVASHDGLKLSLD